MKLLNHQKRLDALQRDLLLSECESSRNRLALEKKDFEVKNTFQLFILNYIFFFSNKRSINYI
jgi:hypothetical protein